MHDGPYRLIPLRSRDGALRAVALVDGADYDWLDAFNWRLNYDGYAVRSATEGGKSSVMMHREICGLRRGDGLEVDHINCARLDNRRANLRVVTRAQNLQNRAYGYGSSAHRGVGWDSRNGVWKAYGKINGQRHSLGTYRDELEAAEAAAAWRAEHMPFSTN